MERIQKQKSHKRREQPEPEDIPQSKTPLKDQLEDVIAELDEIIEENWREIHKGVGEMVLKVTEPEL